MRALAAACLVAACVWAGLTYPLIALAALLVFATIGAVYEAVRNG